MNTKQLLVENSLSNKIAEPWYIYIETCKHLNKAKLLYAKTRAVVMKDRNDLRIAKIH